MLLLFFNNCCYFYGFLYNKEDKRCPRIFLLTLKTNDDIVKINNLHFEYIARYSYHISACHTPVFLAYDTIHLFISKHSSILNNTDLINIWDVNKMICKVAKSWMSLDLKLSKILLTAFFEYFFCHECG